MHWRKLFPSLYLHVGHLDGNRDGVNVEIADTPIRHDMVYSQESKGKVKKPVLQFAKGGLGLLLSKTQAQQIAEVTGRDQFEDWGGKTICIYIDRIKAFGKTQDVLRVKEAAGKAEDFSVPEEEGAAAHVDPEDHDPEDIEE